MHVPLQKVLKIWCSEMASEAFLGLKISLGSLRFSLGMVTEFASWPHAWRLASVVSGTPWNQAKKWRMKASQYFVTLDLILSNACQECVVTALSLCLFSCLCTSILCSYRKVHVGTNLCWRYACFSPTSERSATYIISVKTLVWRLPNLPDLLRQPCQREINA